MGSLVDYDSDGHPEREDATPGPPEDAQRRPRVLPDINTVIQETRAEISQTRLEVDRLICKFADEFIVTAGQLREVVIQHYRERLEGLPAKDRAKVCETLALDEIVCCDMEFGNVNGSHGGLSFTYKAESDAAFNALSHHKWKDLHETFVKHASHSPLGNIVEKRRRSQASLSHSDDENELGRYEDNPRSSSELSELSSDHGGSLSCGVSRGERCRNSCSPSPDWVAEDQARTSDASEGQGLGGPSNQGERDAPKRQAPGRPPNELWSEEEEAMVRETMSMQLGAHGHIAYSRKATMNLEEALPRRTTSAIRNKWLSLRTKETWDERTGTSGKTQVRDNEAKALIKDPDLETHDENDMGSMMEYDDDNDDEFSDRGGRRGLHDLNSWKKARNMVPVLTKSAPQEEKQAPESSSLPHPEWPEQPEATEASESRRKVRPAKEPHAQLWSPQEIEIVTTLTEGLNKMEEIDFKYIAAQLPDPFRRSEKACKSFWVRRVEPRLSKDKNSKHGNEAPAKGPDSNSNLGPPAPTKKDKKRGPDAAISVARRPKHARESGHDDEQPFAARRKRQGSAHAQSFRHRMDHDDGSEAEESDVSMYDFE